MGATYTVLKIINSTSTDIVNISITNFNEAHFWPENSPHKNFDGKKIEAKKSLENPIHLYSPRWHCPFTMTFQFKDDAKDVIRIHPKCADTYKCAFKHLNKNHDIIHKREENTIIITIEGENKSEDREKESKESEATLEEKLFNEGLRLEADGKENEANEKFAEAKKVCEESGDTESLHVVNLKITGNILYNKGIDLTEEVRKLFESNTEAAINKAKEALNKFQEAKSIFEEGLKYSTLFSSSVEITAQQCEDMEHQLLEADLQDLHENTKRLSLSDVQRQNKNTEYLHTETFVQQIDATIK
ncbi:hypothetical protein Zmor_001060 [Zophobas morio]|uniref:Uncharacterized protein n=1 Tax=Zophobas morio TaxID=2755281 RepID=A0AA38J2F1_9CUCU|nr:hypothetical protein Zmor_001060 [Zophobas morio]